MSMYITSSRAWPSLPCNTWIIAAVNTPILCVRPTGAQTPSPTASSSLCSPETCVKPTQYHDKHMRVCCTNPKGRLNTHPSNYQPLVGTIIFRGILPGTNRNETHGRRAPLLHVGIFITVNGLVLFPLRWNGDVAAFETALDFCVSEHSRRLTGHWSWIPSPRLQTQPLQARPPDLA